MTGPEHYREAEKELDAAYVADISDGTAEYHLGKAQVHATLALASATALFVLPPHVEDTAVRRDEWVVAIAAARPQYRDDE
jgi:hypothetical protein